MCSREIPHIQARKGFSLTGSVRHWLSTPQGKSGTYTIPQGITAIGEQAFVWCERLTAVTIPQSVTVIGDWAFEGCVGLTAVTIPGSVTSIGKYAFFACTGLTQEARSAIRARFGDAVFGE
ncbi:MAG: leucine rich repeat protein [Treponematales bacterium]